MAKKAVSESAAGHNFYDLQLITVLKRAIGKLGWRDGFAVVFHHDAAREKFLCEEKRFQGAGQRGRYRLAVGDDIFHAS